MHIERPHAGIKGEKDPAMVKLEIIVDTYTDALLAESAGATQLDLKADFPKGGVTQSIGMIEQICGVLTIPVMVMIRPHDRGFLMTEADIEIMCSDIRFARSVGAEHFLLGCLNEENEIDSEAYKKFQNAAGDGLLHSHLVWELAADPMKALDDLASLGLKSVRSTGGGGLEGKVEKNLPAVRAFAEHAGERIDLFLAGGVHAGNVGKIVSDTGITNIHVGSGAREPASPAGIVNEKKVELIRDMLDTAAVKLS
jgi:copper homeostasis protein